MDKSVGKFKKITKIFFLGSFLWFLFKRKKKSKDICLKDLEYNFYDFLKKEKNEAGQLLSQEESVEEFINDSSSIFKDYFIPHRGNGHHPKILRKKQLLIVLILAIVIKSSFVLYLFFLYPNNGEMSADIQRDVLVLLNEERTSLGLRPLTLNQSLTNSAFAKAEDMLINNYFAHESLDGRMPWDWVSRKDYPYLYIGENLGMNFASADSVHRALMNSPSHKKNILNEKYTDVGVIVVKGALDGRETNILVQIFGTEKKPEPVSSAFVAISPVKIDDSLFENTKTENLENKIEVASSEIFFETVSEEVEKISENKPDNKAGVLKEENILSDNSTETPEKVEEINLVSSSSLMLGDLAKTKIEKQVVGSEVLESNLATEVNLIESTDTSDRYVLAAKISDYLNYILLGLLVLMSVFLMINIVVRFEVQHKPVIVQTLLLLILLFGIYSTRFHFLEKIPNYIALY